MGRNFFSSPKFPSWLWGTPNLMFSMYNNKDHVSRGRVPGSRSHFLQSLRRGSMAAYFLRLWVQIPPGAWMSVCCECCVLSGRGLCDEPITPPEESYLCGVSECDLKTSTMRRPRPNRVVEPLKKKSGWVMNLISCICLVLKLRMSGAISPFPHAFIVCKEINKDFTFLILDAGTLFFFLDRSSGSSRSKSNWKNSVNDGKKRSWRPSRKKISMNIVLSHRMKLNGS